MERKSDKVRRLVTSEQFKPALEIAKDFRIGITHEDREAMSRGYECMIHPDFYRQIGYDPDVEIRKGISVVTRLYGKEMRGNVSS